MAAWHYVEPGWVKAVKQVKRAQQQVWRAERMRVFLERIRPAPGARVVDLGGTPDLWLMGDFGLEVTLVNLADEIRRWPADQRGRFRVVEGDATADHTLGGETFDLVFSNSVIEHVPEAAQGRFAEEVRRLAPAWWIQTPAREFPLEAHCNLPLWWYWPEPLRERTIAWWRAHGRPWRSGQMATTGVVERERLMSLLPGSSLFVERVAGWPKSYTAYRGRP